MREFLFRGKSKKSGSWIKGSLLLMNSNAYIYKSNFGDLGDLDFGYGFEEVDTETVGQFTETYAQDGQQIFEGDIVTVFIEGVFMGTEEVAYRRASFRLKNRHLSGFSNLLIVGSKHDNPELLEVK